MTARERTTRANSGSPPTGEPDYLVVGTLRRPHGLRGEILMDVRTDFPERLKGGVTVFLGRHHEPAVISACRPHARGLLIHFQALDSREAAAAYCGRDVYVLTADRPRLPAGQYYHHELLGCDVVDEDRGSVGALVEILQTGANDVYVIKGASGRELLLPAIEGVVLEIDPSRHLIRVRTPDGIEAPAGGRDGGSTKPRGRRQRSRPVP